MKKLLLYLLIVTPFILASCSKNTTSPVNPVDTTQKAVNYLPLASGNLWIQVAHNLDTNGMTMDTYNDTLTSSATMSYKSKNAATVIHTNMGSPDTTHYVSEGTKIYIGADSYEKTMNAVVSSFVPGLKLSLGTDWVKIADVNATTWTAVETTIKDLPFSYGGFDALMNGTIKITGMKGTDTTITLNNKQYSAKGFDVNVIFNGVASIPLLKMDNAAQVQTTASQKYWFIDGIGFYKTIQGNTALNVVFNPQFQSPPLNQKFGGKVGTTTSYMLK